MIHPKKDLLVPTLKVSAIIIKTKQSATFQDPDLLQVKEDQKICLGLNVH